MALPLNNNAEGGSAGVQVTTGNSGGASGDAFEQVTAAANGSSTTFDTTHPSHGSLGYKLVGGNPAGTNLIGWVAAFGSPTEIYGRMYLYMTAWPASGIAVLFQVDLQGTGTCAAIAVHNIGVIQCYDTVSATTGGVGVSVNQLVRIEFHVTISTTGGLVEARLYNTSDSSTIDETITRSSANTRASCNAAYFGYDSQQPASYTCWLDGLNVNSTAYPGPVVTVAAPTLSVVTGARW